MLVTITNEQKVLITLAPVTEAGNPAPIDGVPVWEVLSGDATIEPSEDGLSCTLISGEVGNSQIQVSADADMDEDEVRTLTDIIDLVVVSAEASTLGLVIGQPESK